MMEPQFAPVCTSLLSDLGSPQCYLQALKEPSPSDNTPKHGLLQKDLKLLHT